MLSACMASFMKQAPPFYAVVLAVLTCFAASAKAQTFADPCFNSPAVSTSFASTPDVFGTNSDALQWTGATWIGDWPGANITLAPPGGTAGIRAIWTGDGSVWTTGGEGFGLRLTAPISTGVTYNFTFTRVSHGTGSAGNYQPTMYTNNGGSFGFSLGNIPSAGGSWFTGLVSFTAVAAQNGHSWVYFHSTNGATGSGMFVGCPVILPMSLWGFEGWYADDGVSLQWQVADDLGYAEHVVERSEDGIGFARVGALPAADAEGERVYDFRDELLDGVRGRTLYYRIKSVHRDAGEALSEVVRIDLSAHRDDLRRVFPNPVRAGGAIQVDYVSASEQQVVVLLLDQLGKQVLRRDITMTKGMNRLALPLGELRRGLYMLQLAGKNEIFSERIFIR